MAIYPEKFSKLPHRFVKSGTRRCPYIFILRMNGLLFLLKKSFHFDKWESLFMELSRKFDFPTIEALARTHHFKVKEQFYRPSELFCGFTVGEKISGF